MFERVLKTVEGQMKIRIPSMLNELSVGQLMALQALVDPNDLEVVSILSGVSINNLYDICMITDLQQFNETIIDLLNQVKNNYDAELIPEKITFKLPLPPEEAKSSRPFKIFHKPAPGYKNVTVDVIKTLSVEPAGAYMNAKDIIADEIAKAQKIYGDENWAANFMPPLEAACKVLGHYFYAKVYGHYDEYKASEFSEQVKKLPVTEALPIAAFFFLNYPDLSKRRISFWHRVQQYSRKRREYKRLKNLPSLIQSIH